MKAQTIKNTIKSATRNVLRSKSTSVKKTINLVWQTCVVGAVGISMMSAKAEAAYVFQPVNFPNDNFTQLLGINNAGAIAGYHGANINQGFTLNLPNTTTFTDENFPGSVQTQVVGINNLGSTAGFYVDTAGTTHGFLNTAGTFLKVDAPNTAFNQLLGLNDNGVAAGYSSTDAGGAILQKAYIDNNGTFSYIPVGNGTQNSQATGINDNGLVSGFFFDANNVSHGFLYNGTTLTQLDAPNSIFTQALGLNNQGQVDGVYIDTNNVQHGFVDTNGVFQTVDEPLGVGTTTVNGINDKGQIVGFFVDGNDATQGFVGTPVPEPGLDPVSLPLLAGVGALVTMKVRQSKQQTN